MVTRGMIPATRVGSLDIAQVISERLGSYVDMSIMEFVAVDGDRIHCWYMNSGGEGPSFHIPLISTGDDWKIELTEHPQCTGQNIEIP